MNDTPTIFFVSKKSRKSRIRTLPFSLPLNDDNLAVDVDRVIVDRVMGANVPPSAARATIARACNLQGQSASYSGAKITRYLRIWEPLRS